MVRASTRNIPVFSELSWELTEEPSRVLLGAWRNGEREVFVLVLGERVRAWIMTGLVTGKRGQIQELLGRLNQWGWLVKWIWGKEEWGVKDSTEDPSLGHPKIVIWLIRTGVDLRSRRMRSNLDMLNFTCLWDTPRRHPRGNWKLKPRARWI